MSAQGEALTARMAAVGERHTFDIAEQVESMRAMISVEAESREGIERLVEASRERERRLLKAIAALEGVPLSAGGRPAAKAKPKPAPKAAQPVGEGTVSRVFEAVQRLHAQNGNDSFSRQDVIAILPDVSGETIRRALGQLRDAERIRLAGKRGTGPRAQNLYALMPDDR